MLHSEWPSTNGERTGHNHPKFEGGKIAAAVVMPPQTHRELQGKQNSPEWLRLWGLLWPRLHSRRTVHGTFAWWAKAALKVWAGELAIARYSWAARFVAAKVCLH